MPFDGPSAIGAAVGLFARLVHRTSRFTRTDDPPVPGVLPLVLLVPWAFLVTLLAPMIFDGLAVLNPTGADRRLAAGVVTHSNIAQNAYLFLGVCVVVFLSRSRHTGAQLIGTAAGLATLLSFWSYLHRFGVPFPEGIFDNSPFFPMPQRRFDPRAPFGRSSDSHLAAYSRRGFLGVGGSAALLCALGDKPLDKISKRDVARTDAVSAGRS